jgi:hypothetical protein
VLGRGAVALDGHYSRADVDHVDVVLSIAGVDQATQSVPVERFDEPLTFNHLRANTSYRATMNAYRSAGSSDLISNPASSYVDASTGTDNASWSGTTPTLQVQLIDRKPYEVEDLGTDLAANLPAIIGATAIQAVDANTFYLTSSTFVAKVVLDARLHPTVTTLQSIGTGSAMVRDAASGTTYFMDRPSHKIYKIDSSDAVSLVIDFATDGTGLEEVYGLWLEAGGTSLLFADDSGTKQIKRLDIASKAITPLLGQTPTLTDGAATFAGFSDPIGVAVGPDGRLFVSDGKGTSPSGALREADATFTNPALAATTFVRTDLTDGGQGPGVDGSLAAASLQGPVRSLTVDATGNLWFADDGGLRRVDRDGYVARLSAIAEDGTSSSCAGAQAVSVAPDGTIFVGTPTSVYRVR